MHILVDMDDTVADWSANFDSYLDDEWYKALSANIKRKPDRVGFNLHGGCTPEESGIINDIMDIPGFYSELEPIDGAIEALNEMLADGHTVTLVSSPWNTNPTCASDKITWAEEVIGKGWGDRVVITKDKTAVRGDILIDDKPDIKGDYDPQWTQILFNQPYNRYKTGLTRLFRWKEWASIVTLTDYLAKNSPKIVKRGIWINREAWEGGKIPESKPGVDDGFGSISATREAPKFSGEVRSVSSTGAEKGVKQARFDLIPVGALTKLAEHYGAGALKYDDNQWRKGYEFSKSYAAMMRHATQWWDGEEIDEELNSHHLAAVAWHSFALLTYLEENPQFDDRFKKEVSNGTH